MGKHKENAHVVLGLYDFLAKLGIKSARRNVPSKFVTGKNVEFYLNGVKMKYAEADYVLNDNPGDLTLFGPKR